MKPVKYQHTITQSTVLTSAKDDLDADQRRILYICLDTINKQGWPRGGEFKIDPKVYAANYGISVHEARADIRNAMLRFYKPRKGENAICGVTFVDKEEIPYDLVDVFIPWVSIIKSARKRGDYTIGINERLRPYMEPMAHDLRYSIWQYDELKIMSSEYTLRLYENLCSFRRTGNFYISHAQLIESWSLPPSYQTSRALVKVNVIDRSMKEIIKKSTMIKGLSLQVVRGERNRAEKYLFSFEPF